MKSRVHPKYKAKYYVGNWPSYDRALVQRGDVTFWLSPDAIEAWRPEPSKRPGAPRRFSDLAIETAMAMRLIFRLPLLDGDVVRVRALSDRSTPRWSFLHPRWPRCPCFAVAHSPSPTIESPELSPPRESGGVWGADVRRLTLCAAVRYRSINVGESPPAFTLSKPNAVTSRETAL